MAEYVCFASSRGYWGTGSVHYTGLGWGGYTLLLTLEYVSFGCWLALCTGTGGTAIGSFSECVLPPPPAHDVSVRRPIEHQLAELSFVCFRNSPKFVIVKYSISSQRQFDIFRILFCCARSV